MFCGWENQSHGADDGDEIEELKEVTRLHYTDNLDEWEEEFIQFYDKFMYESPPWIIPGEDENLMCHIDLLNYLGVDSWNQVMEYQGLQTSNEQDEKINKYYRFLLNNYETVSAYHHDI